MYPHPYAQGPTPAPVRRWWQHPALIITALVVLPPAGIALAWTGPWDRSRKVLATVLSGVWFLIPLLSDSPDGAAADAAPRAAASPTPSASPSASPAASATPTPAATADPLMPGIVGRPFGQAEVMVETLIDGELTARSAYTDVALPAEYGAWTVCFQDLGAGTGLAPRYAAPVAHLVAPGTTCPARPDTVLRPAPSPAPTTAPRGGSTDSPGSSGTSGASGGSASGGSGGSGGSSASGGGGGDAEVSYRNCAAVRAAGADPIRRGDPGYGRHLDRDGDGVGCE
ncbi:excalibur calcium-binding domain-containing protein [Streptomyces sp. NPDC004436]